MMSTKELGTILSDLMTEAVTLLGTILSVVRRDAGIFLPYKNPNYSIGVLKQKSNAPCVV